MKNTNELETIVRYARMRKACPPYMLVQEYKKLRFLSARLSTIDTQYCNGELAEGVDDKKRVPVYKNLDDILTPYGLHWYHQSDPRGASLYVSQEPITRENYTYALCIY